MPSSADPQFPIVVPDRLGPEVRYEPAVGTHFRVWAPRPQAISLEISAPALSIPLERDARGYASILVPQARPGTRYQYRLTDTSGAAHLRPDPGSRFQPEGVHGPSEVIAPLASAPLSATLPGTRLETCVLYELHVGTFTAAGTLDGATADLDRLRDLGVTAVELMPLAAFPGERNWGYDGVFPFAVQTSYGGPAALRRFIEACHARRLAVIVDVVYNHLGPEGNYLAEFAPYFTDRYRTPWGAALNFDGPESDSVRAYFIANALMWLAEYGADGLRLDAIHGIVDTSATPFLAELSAAVDAEAARRGARWLLIAESDLNDVRVLRPRALGGFGMPAQWSDDFHHALHALLTGERQGYYQDFGAVADLAQAFRDGFVYEGRYSHYRRRRFGNSAAGFPPSAFVVCAQNHDQIGNRAAGDRLAAHLNLEQLKLAAACVLLSPFVPLLFMGEEYGESAPFPYFVDHGDPALIEAVRHGRRQDFAGFDWSDAVPDPAAVETFTAARLNRDLLEQPAHRLLTRWYRELLRLRQDLPSDKIEVASSECPPILCWRRGAWMALLYFGAAPWSGEIRLPAGSWAKRLDSAAEEWHGPGALLPETIASDGAATASWPAWNFTLWRENGNGLASPQPRSSVAPG